MTMPDTGDRRQPSAIDQQAQLERDRLQIERSRMRLQYGWLGLTTLLAAVALTGWVVGVSKIDANTVLIAELGQTVTAQFDTITDLNAELERIRDEVADLEDEVQRVGDGTS